MENGNQRLGSVYHGITLLAYCGGGAYGEVYYGKDLTGRAFAVKIVMKSRIGDHWARELNQPNAVYETGQALELDSQSYKKHYHH